jgi:hypothetical protein
VSITEVVVHNRFPHGFAAIPLVGVVQIKGSVFSPTDKCESVGQARFLHGIPGLVGAVQYLKSCLALKAKAPPTTANMDRERNMNFTFFINWSAF